MAARRKPAPKKIKFEVTRSGVAGIGIVCFCIFLWMFLLGVWAGQSLLLPPVKSGKGAVKQTESAPPAQSVPLHIEADARKKIKKNS